jgi:hypothetical protein
MVGGGGVTGGGGTPGGWGGDGGMGGGGLLSDDKAKLRAVYLQGLADGGPAKAGTRLKEAGDIYGDAHLDANRPLTRQEIGSARSPFAGASASGSGLTDREIEARTSEAAAFDDESTLPLPASMMLSGGASLINLGRAQAERHLGLGVEPTTYGVGRVVEPAKDNTYEEWQRAAGHDGVRRYPGAPSDPVTEQFARGLAPIRYEYQPGMGPPGRQTGVRAQQAETQPVTASMITRRPDGLRQIDPAMGLGTALAGVGHLAQKQREQEARINELLGVAARREGY